MWTPTIAVSETGDSARSSAPLFVRIAQAVSDDVLRGRLKQGARLPGARSLAATLGVSRDTVTAAYNELRAQGWVETKSARGVFVTTSIPDARPRRIAQTRRMRTGIPEAPGFRMDGAEATSGDSDADPIAIRQRRSAEQARAGKPLNLAWGVPDLREFPVAEYARALRRQLRVAGRSVLGYGDAQGHARLREELASMLSARRGLAATPADIVVVRGSQMGLALVARTLVTPGDVIAVEALGYRPAWAAFEAAGARLLHVPIDGDGLDVDALERHLKTRGVRAVYVTPHHQYPTTATLSPERRLRLLDAARRHRFAIIEDDYDHEVHYDGRPILPLASIDREGLVVYVGTMSKTLAPSLRIGYVVAPRQLTARIAALRRDLDRQGDLAVEAAVADLMADGTLRRHVFRTQRLYRQRRDAIVHALGAKLPGALTFNVPSGGMALWANATPAIDVDAWSERVARRGVLLRTGRTYMKDLRPLASLRLSFAALREDELREAVRHMAACV
ncbi:MAG: PLP-dependent aminotransferase family protein [Planctomycetes bacterium]|nr:PLP-dependent aminotransferase family protein [Planctomycetota bacterium]